MSNNNMTEEKNRALETKKQLHKVTLIGSEGAGKSCFLGGLSKLGSDPNGSPFDLTPRDSETAGYLQELRKSFDSGKWAPSTNVVTILSYMIKSLRSKVGIDVVTIDYPGEDFRKNFALMTLEKMEALKKHLFESSVIMVLLDANELVSAKTPEEKNLVNEKLNALLRAVTLTAEEYAKSTHGKYEKIDLCVVLTKADAVKELKGYEKNPDVAKNFAEQFFKGGPFIKKLSHELGIAVREIKFFAVSCIGDEGLSTDSQSSSPLVVDKIKPAGYTALLNWLFERQERIRNRRLKYVGTSVLVVILILCVLAGMGKLGKKKMDASKIERTTTVLEDEEASPTEKIGLVTPDSPQPVKETGYDVHKATIQSFQTRIDNANQVNTLIEIRKEVEDYLNEVKIESWKEEVRELMGKIDNKVRELRLMEVKTLSEQKSPEFLEKAQIFIREFPKAKEKETVQGFIETHYSDQAKAERNNIKNMPVVDVSTLTAKYEAIYKFLDNPQNKTRCDSEILNNMKNAADWAKTFCEQHQYTVRVKQYGGLNDKYFLRLIVTTNDDESFRHESSGKSKEVNISSDFKINWKYGDEIKITLERYGWGEWHLWLRDWAVVGKSNFPKGFVFELLSEKTTLKATSDWEGYQNEGGFFASFELVDFSEQDKRDFENYISPGDSW